MTDNLDLILRDVPFTPKLWGKQFGGRVYTDCESENPIGYSRKARNKRELNLYASLNNTFSLKGNWPNVLYGHNASTLNRWEMIEVKGILEDQHKIKLDRAIVTQLDWAGTIKVPYSVESYFRFFGPCTYRNKGSYDSSLYYSNKRRVINIYNKGKEMRSKLPIDMLGNHWMRIEVRYKNTFMDSLCTSLGLKYPLELKDLLKYEVYEALVFRWVEEYNSIQKIMEMREFPSNIRTPTMLKEMLISSGMESWGGLCNILDMLEYNFDNMDKKLTYAAKSVLRGEAKRIAANLHVMKNSERIIELDKLVDQEAHRYLTLSA